MIKEFNPQVYPTRLWVTKDATLSEIDKDFYALDDKNNREEFKRVHELPDANIYATTYPVSNKESGWRGCLVYLNRRDMPLSTLTHESSHCFDWLAEQLGLVSGTTFENGEARSYYVAWVFNCLLEVKNGIKSKKQ